MFLLQVENMLQMTSQKAQGQISQKSTVLY